MRYDVVIVGGGAAGLAAAIQAHKQHCSVLILERNPDLGGILPQCIHEGFGSFVFNKMLTGPEYAQRFIDKIDNLGIEVKTQTTVVGIQEDKTITAVNKRDGLITLQAKSIIFAMGCRERTRNQILIPGMRPAGVYTAGTVQKMINREGVMPGKDIVILGSGDIGLIMARRLTLEGAHVKGVYEIQSEPSGLTRNIVQCLEDYAIPLFLHHTISYIHGEDRVRGVTISEIDSFKTLIKGSERYLPCDCVVLAVGLIPEIELGEPLAITIDEKTNGFLVDTFFQTTKPGIFACGNVVTVFDLVDDVTKTGEIAGYSAAKYAKGILSTEQSKMVEIDTCLAYVVPQKISTKNGDLVFYCRSLRTIKPATISVYDGKILLKKKHVRIMKPTEMMQVCLSNDEVRKSNDGNIRIVVNEG